MNDLYLIQGIFPVRPSLPSIVGNEGVGRVLAIGSGVRHLKVGDRVLIPLYAFSWRERLVVPSAGLFSLPDADPQQLAMLGINPPTASLLLDEASNLKPGDWVIQNAANSGVGRSLIAIAKARDIKTINLVRRPELVPELQAIGGDLVVVDEKGALDKIQAAVGNGRVQLAIDGVASKSSSVIASALSAHGLFVVYAMMGGGPVMINPFDLIGKRIIVKGFFMNHPDIEPKIPAALREAVPLVASGAIRVLSPQPILSPRCAKRFFTRGGAEKCFSILAQGPEPAARSGKDRNGTSLAAIDKIEALNPRAVVVGHGSMEPDNAPWHIQETRRHIQDFIRLDDQTHTAQELYDRTLALYPDRINPGSFWGSASAANARHHGDA